MGGVERASANTANGLINLDSNLEVVFLSIFNKEKFFELDRRVICIQPDDFNIEKLDFIKTLAYIRRNIHKYKSTSSDLSILVFGKFYGALTSIAILGVNISFFISDRNSPLFRWRFPFNIFNKIAYTLNPPKGVIAQTEIAAYYQKKYFKKSKIQVIPNSVRDVTLYPEVKRKNVILAVGRLNDYLKGFDLLLESVALLHNQDWELHIAGGDENGEALKQQANTLGIRHRVKFLGKIKEIDRCYAYAGIYVIPSRSEGFPNALLEAMAAGCPCISFNFTAGPQDIITHNYDGILVPNGAVDKLAQAIDALIVNDTLRLKISGNALEVRERYGIEKIVHAIQAFMS